MILPTNDIVSPNSDPCEVSYPTTEDGDVAGNGVTVERSQKDSPQHEHVAEPLPTFYSNETEGTVYTKKNYDDDKYSGSAAVDDVFTGEIPKFPVLSKVNPEIDDDTPEKYFDKKLVPKEPILFQSPPNDQEDFCDFAHVDGIYEGMGDFASENIGGCGFQNTKEVMPNNMLVELSRSNSKDNSSMEKTSIVNDGNYPIINNHKLESANDETNDNKDTAPNMAVECLTPIDDESKTLKTLQEIQEGLHQDSTSGRESWKAECDLDSKRAESIAASMASLSMQNSESCTNSFHEDAFECKKGHSSLFAYPSINGSANLDVFSNHCHTMSDKNLTTDIWCTQDPNSSLNNKEAEFRDDADLLHGLTYNSSTYLDTIDRAGRDKGEREGKTRKEERLKLYHSYCLDSKSRSLNAVCEDDGLLVNGEKNRMDDDDVQSYGSLHNESDEMLEEEIGISKDSRSTHFYSSYSREEGILLSNEDSENTLVFDTTKFESAREKQSLIPGGSQHCLEGDAEETKPITKPSLEVEKSLSQSDESTFPTRVVRERSTSSKHKEVKIPLLKPIPPEKIAAYLKSQPNRGNTGFSLGNPLISVTGNIEDAQTVDGLICTEDTRISDKVNGLLNLDNLSTSLHPPQELNFFPDGEKQVSNADGISDNEKSNTKSYDEIAEKNGAADIKIEGEKSGLGCMNGMFKISEELTKSNVEDVTTTHIEDEMIVHIDNDTTINLDDTTTHVENEAISRNIDVTNALQKEDNQSNVLQSCLHEQDSQVTSEESASSWKGESEPKITQSLDHNVHSELNNKGDIKISKQSDAIEVESNLLLNEGDKGRGMNISSKNACATVNGSAEENAKLVASKYPQSEYANASDSRLEGRIEHLTDLESCKISKQQGLGNKLINWVTNVIFSKTTDVSSEMYIKALTASESTDKDDDALKSLQLLLEESDTINLICEHVVECVRKETKPVRCERERIDLESEVLSEASTNALSDGFSSTLNSTIVMENAVLKLLRRNEDLKPFSMPSSSSCDGPSSILHSANFVSFLHKVSYLTGIEAPIKKNHYLDKIVLSSLPRADLTKVVNNEKQSIFFGNDIDSTTTILNFLYEASIAGISTRPNDDIVQEGGEIQLPDDNDSHGIDEDNHIICHPNLCMEKERFDDDDVTLLSRGDENEANLKHLGKENEGSSLRKCSEQAVIGKEDVFEENSLDVKSNTECGSICDVNKSDENSCDMNHTEPEKGQESPHLLLGGNKNDDLDITKSVPVKAINSTSIIDGIDVKNANAKNRKSMISEMQISVKEQSIKLLSDDETNHGSKDNPSKDPLIYDVSPEETYTTPIACCDVIGMLTMKSTKQSRNQHTVKSETSGKELSHKMNYHIIPQMTPSPFEIAVWNVPSIVTLFLAYLGDPIVVCRMKMVNTFCNRIITANEYAIMKDSVRAGGINPKERPAFWLWLTLEKYKEDKNDIVEESESVDLNEIDENCLKTPLNFKALRLETFEELEQAGREGKWHHTIHKDVLRAFGNMPPHKTSRMKTKSIVRALVSWGQGHFSRKNVNEASNQLSSPCSIDSDKEKPLRRLTVSSPVRNDSIIENQPIRSDQQMDSPSDLSVISPTQSSTSSDILNASSQNGTVGIDTDIFLYSNSLTSDMKLDLQNKLQCILHAIAAAHPGFGYCQGIDYIVAHLLRTLHNTIERNMSSGKLSNSIRSAKRIINPTVMSFDNALVVEEAIFRVMDVLLTKYNLRHMYWPGLRCLLTCCRVFEHLIKMKLPVLADHFDHHEVCVSHFAQGWFQTLFFYIPSMPSSTINHMWDIWLVERSMKIFFRVGTAILFLSQPILLNNEFEGMMVYLNTLPDATLLNPDILIKCALQIKITNQMLTQIELEVVQENDRAHGWSEHEINMRYKDFL